MYTALRNHCMVKVCYGLLLSLIVSFTASFHQNCEFNNDYTIQELWYTQNFAAREKNLLKHMLGLLQVSLKTWRSTLRNYCKQREKDHKKARKSEATKQQRLMPLQALECLVKTLCMQRSVNAKKLYITQGDKLATDGLTLWINEQEFGPTRAQKEVALLHEIMHIKHGDAFVDDCLQQLFSHYGSALSKEDFKKWHTYFKQLRHLHEERADVQAGLTSLLHARANVEDCKTWLEVQGDQEYPMHPLNSVRLAYMQTLVDRMSGVQKLNQNTWIVV